MSACLARQLARCQSTFSVVRLLAKRIPFVLIFLFLHTERWSAFSAGALPPVQQINVYLAHLMYP